MQVVNSAHPVCPADLAFSSPGLYRYRGISASRWLTWFDSDAGQSYIYPDWFGNQSGVICYSLTLLNHSTMAL
jgi:hypothetical protein